MAKIVPKAFSDQGFRFATPEEEKAKIRRAMVEESLANLERSVKQTLEERENAETLLASHPDCIGSPDGRYTLEDAVRLIEARKPYQSKIDDCAKRLEELSKAKTEIETLRDNHPTLTPGKGKTYLEHAEGLFIKD